MIAPGDRRPAGRAVPQNRQLTQVQQRRPPPPTQYAGPSPTQQEYQPSPITPSQPPYRQHAPQQTYPTPGYDEEDDFPESQAPQTQQYPPPMHAPYYPPGPSTPAQNVRPGARQRIPETYEMSPSQPMRRPAAGEGQGQGQGVKASHILAAIKQMEPRIDGLASDTRGIRDAVHDLGQQMQVIPAREEIKDDMREYLGPALVQMKSDIMDAMKDQLKQVGRGFDDRFRSVSDQIAGLRSMIAGLPQQNNVASGPDKTTTALLEALIAALRPVDELKNVLLPLNLPQTMFNLGTHMASLHSKTDQALEISRAIPAAQTTLLDISRALTKVDTRTASQEQAGKDSSEFMKRVDDSIRSLQAESSANREALSVIRKEVEARAEADREAAWRRSHSVEQSIQTAPPATYVDQQTTTAPCAAYVDQQTAPASPAAYVSQQIGTDRIDLAQLASPPQVFERRLTSSVASMADAPVLVLRASGIGPVASSSTLAGGSSQAAPAPTPEPTPKPAPKKKLKRKATQGKKPIPAPWMTDSFEEAEKEKETAAAAAKEQENNAPAAAAASNDDGPADVFGPVSQLPTLPTTTGPKSKKRKISAQSQSSSSGTAAQRRSRRERKSPTRFGQASQPPVEQGSAGVDVLVPGTQQPTGPSAKKGGPSVDKGSTSKLARTATNGIIDLTADSLNSIESSDQSQSKHTDGPIRLQSNLPSSRPNVPSSQLTAVPETQLSSIEPRRVTPSTTQGLDTFDRRAYFQGPGSGHGSPGLDLLARCASSSHDKAASRPTFLANQGERIGLDDPLGDAIEPDDMTGSQLLGFETDEDV